MAGTPSELVASELKPSEQKSLTKATEMLDDVQSLLGTDGGGLDAAARKAHARDLKRAESSIRRAERSLSRLADQSDLAANELDRMRSLATGLAEAQNAIVQSDEAGKAAEQQQLAQLQALLESPDTKHNVERMEELSRQFLDTWQTFGVVDGRFTHGLFKLWDAERIGLVEYVLNNASELQAEAEQLLNSYEPLTKTSEGARLLLVPTRDLRTNLERFTAKLPGFIDALAPAQKLAAQEFHAELDKQQRIFDGANKSRDRSALLMLNPHFPQLDTTRNRLKSQVLVYAATGGLKLSDLKKLRSEALAHADEVALEIEQWQQQQETAEAAELAKQQAEYVAQQKANAQRMEADAKAWQERREVIEQRRQAQQERNARLRAVTK